MNNHGQVDGIPVHVLRGRRIEAAVAPALGGKLLRLRSLPDGREWMWAPADGRGLFASAAGTPFEDGSLCGADDCFPTVAPCIRDGRVLPDHGESWTTPADVVHATDSALRLRQRLDSGVLLRSWRVADDCLRMDYALRARGPSPWLWAFHPLLACAPGDVLHLPDEVRQLRVESQSGLPGTLGSGHWAWPTPGEGVRLDRLDLGTGRRATAKLFAAMPAREVAVVVQRQHDALTLRFDGRHAPWLGLWLSQDGWHGHRHVAIEPSTADADVPPLQAAPETRGRTLRWWLELAIQPTLGSMREDAR